jgi:hypothetical protein
VTCNYRGELEGRGAVEGGSGCREEVRAKVLTVWAEMALPDS